MNVLMEFISLSLDKKLWSIDGGITMPRKKKVEEKIEFSPDGGL